MTNNQSPSADRSCNIYPANIHKLLEELEHPESGIREYGISIDDALYLIKYIRIIEREYRKMRDFIEERGIQHDEDCHQEGVQPCCQAKFLEKKLLHSLQFP